MNLMKLAIDQLSLWPKIKKAKQLRIYSIFRLLILRYFEEIMYVKKDQDFRAMVCFVLEEIKKKGFCYVDLIREKLEHEFGFKWEKILENPSVPY